MRILFVTWDGPQVSYLEGLFLPIFRCLAERGWKFHILQFTWGDRQVLQRSREVCEEAGVPYRAVRVWRKPVSIGSLMTAVMGARDISRAVADWEIDLIMPRSTLPVLSCMLAMKKKILPMVFDADGLPLDERVDFGGMSSRSIVYRILRDVEAQGVRRASAVLTRTSKAIDILSARAGAGTSRQIFHTVTNGRDAEIFSPVTESQRLQVRNRLGVADSSPLMVYAGSLGGKYQFDEMLSLFSMVLSRRPDTRLLVLTGSPELALESIDAFPEIKSLVITLTVNPKEMHEYLGAADVGLALIKRSFSMQAATAIKVGEYLLCGLPIIATDGVGDALGVTSEVGFLMESLTESALKNAADWFVDDVIPARNMLQIRARQVGLKYYSLESSVDSYGRALESVVS